MFRRGLAGRAGRLRSPALRRTGWCILAEGYGCVRVWRKVHVLYFWGFGLPFFPAGMLILSHNRGLPYRSTGCRFLKVLPVSAVVLSASVSTSLSGVSPPLWDMVECAGWDPALSGYSFDCESAKKGAPRNPPVR